MPDHKIYKKKREKFKYHDGCEVKFKGRVRTCEVCVEVFGKQGLPDEKHEELQPVGGKKGVRIREAGGE